MNWILYRIRKQWKRMMIRIEELKKLIQAYQDGEIAERDASSAYKW